jgi:hypothetical protein
MRKFIAATAGTALLLSGLTLAGAPAAGAATTWDFTGGSFTLSDGQGGTGTLAIQNMQLAGSSASGTITLSNGGRSSCSTHTFSGLTATFTLDGQFNPCSGTVTFSIDPVGTLTVGDTSVYIPSTLLTGPGTGSVKGSGPQVTSCTVAVSGDQADVQWMATGSGIGAFSVGVVNGQQANVDVPGTASRATVSLAGEPPGPLSIAIEINGDGNLIFPCPDFSYFPVPGKPSIVALIPASGGLLTVNYSVADPTTVQGIEYSLDGGSWTRPGGQAPVNGSGGSFTLSGLIAGQHTVTLRSIGLDSVQATDGDPKSATVLPTGTLGKPSNSSGKPAIGSSPSNLVPVPPSTPVSAVAGTSNGAGTGTNGALAATTGDGGVDAPCLAPDGTLYPNQYSTVGSQLTMAPNIHGLGIAKSFIVIGGALPPGMQLDRTYGVLFGVTAQAGSWVTTVRAKFANGSTKTSQFTTRVDAEPQTLQYAAQNIGSVGTRIAIAPTTNAPVTATSYVLVCGKLPPGTRLDPRTGLITGKPTKVVALPTPLRVAETSTAGRSAASFIFVVNKRGKTAISYPSHPRVRVGKRGSIRPTVAGVGDIALFRMWKGKLPRGLHLNRRTGVITGRLGHRGSTHTITIVAVTRGGALLTAAPMRISITR